MTESTELPTYSHIYAFGDSLSDAGNDSLLAEAAGFTPASPPYYQEIDDENVPLLGAVPVPVSVFSNGPTWVQDLSVSLGLGTLTPSLLGGTDFAFGGAETGLTPQNGSDEEVLAISLPAQLAEFQELVAKPAAGALYTLSIGANDVLDILANPSLSIAQQAADVAAAVANEVYFVNQLVADGAKNLLVLDVPDLAKTPDVMDGLVNGSGTPSAALDTEASDLSNAYNAALTLGLAGIAIADNVDVTVVNVYQLIDEAVADPAAYGLTNVTSPVWSGNYTSASSGTLAATGAAAQDQYLFFDNLHPTETGEQAMAALAEADLGQPSELTYGPAIAGTIAGQMGSDQATIAPFSTVTIADADSGETETVTVTLSNAASGTLSNLDGGSYAAATGVYTVSGTVAQVTAALDGLVFQPALDQAPAGQTATTTFTIDVTDTSGVSATDSTTSVVATETSPTYALVQSAYTAILRTSPTAAYVAQNALQIDADQVTLAQFENGLIASDQALYTTLPVLVTIDACFGATPQSAGLTAVAADTGSPAQVGGFYSATYLHSLGFSDPNVWTIMASQWGADPNSAFYAMYSSYGSDYSAFISAVYQREFGYAPSATNLGYLVGDVQGVENLLAGPAGAATPIQVVSGIYGYLLYVGQTYGIGEYGTAANAFLQAAANGTVVYGPELTQEFPTDPSVVTITDSDESIDPGTSFNTMQFLAGASGDTLLLNPGGLDQVSGFNPGTDVLDFSALLGAAGIDLNGDIAALGNYVTVVDQGANALVNFDPTGHGGGGTVAVLQGLGSTVTGLGTLIADNAIRIV